LKASFNLKNLAIIIMEPETPANIGAIARATKNMGISDIRLVNPTPFKTDDAYKLAHGARDQLETFQTVDTLAEAIKDIHILIGTTNRRREKHWPTLEPKELMDGLCAPSQTHKIGLLFGRESDGLTNDELQVCNQLTHIPTAGYHPAINLAQAVMIYSYEAFSASPDKEAPYTWDPANKKEEQSLYDKIKETLPCLPINPKKGVDEFVSLFRRVLGRTTLESRDIRLLHKLFDLIRRQGD
jgi:TrmH family RNA methyltransferase